MERDRVATQYDEMSPCMVELDENIAKVVVELDHARVRGTKRTGRLARE